MKEIITRIRIDDNGNVIKTFAETRDLVNIDEYMNDGYYTVMFDESSSYWSDDRDMNALFLVQNQRYLDTKLETKGYLLVNDVLDAIGLPRTKRGMIDGWDHTKGDRIYLGLDKKENYCPDSSNIKLDFNVRENIFGLHI